MVGDYHLEIVEKEGSVELFVSDALRRPLQATGGVAIFDSGAARPLAWSSYRLTSDRPALYSSAEYRVTLADGTPLAVTLAREDLARLSGAAQSAFAR